MNKKTLVLLAIALIIGIFTSFIAYGKIKTNQAKTLELVPVVVASNDIEAYSVLSADNLKIEQVSAKFADDFTATDISQLTDRITNIPLYSGRPIDIRLVTEKPEEIGNKQVVGVHIDAVRFAGVNDGDTVDVYWLDKGTAAIPAQKIGHNVKVLRVTNDKGIPVNDNLSISRSAAASAGLVDGKNPRIVYLLLDPEEVPYVIQGSVPGSNSISLSKKPVEDTVTTFSLEEVSDEESASFSQ